MSIRKRFKKRVIKTIIIKQFKALWAVKFHSLKRPQEYALLLNVSSVYLNEAVKKDELGISAYVLKSALMEMLDI